MKNLIKIKNIKKIAIVVIYVLSIIFFINCIIIYRTMQEKLNELENNSESISEWYIELKYKNIYLENEISDLVLENFNIYKQMLNNKKNLNENANRTIEEFKEYYKLLDSVNSKIIKQKQSMNENQQKAIELKDEIEKNKIGLAQKLKYPSFDYLKAVTVYIRGTSSNGTGWAGTGIIVKGNDFVTYILTNAHIAGRGKENVGLNIEDTDRYRLATVVAMHDKLDLALIKINGTLKGKCPIKGISIRIKPQDKIYLVGHHLGRKYVYGEGVFAGYDGVQNIIQIPTLYGNSGSGVFNKEGKLISLIFAINRVGFMDVDCAHGLGIDSLNIIHFLKNNGVL